MKPLIIVAALLLSQNACSHQRQLSTELKTPIVVSVHKWGAVLAVAGPSWHAASCEHAAARAVHYAGFRGVEITGKTVGFCDIAIVTDNGPSQMLLQPVVVVP